MSKQQNETYHDVTWILLKVINISESPTTRAGKPEKDRKLIIN